MNRQRGTLSLLRQRGLRLVLPAAMLAWLAGCGFQLRGSYEVPAFLEAVSLKLPPAGGSNLGTELRLALERKHIATTGGDLQLEVVSEQLTRQTSSVDSSARAAEYVLIYNVTFRVNSSDGRLIGPLQTLILRRSYQYSAANVVGKSTEEETLVRELHTDAAQQIVRQLVALKVSPATPTPPATPAAAPEAAPQ